MKVSTEQGAGYRPSPEDLMRRVELYRERVVQVGEQYKQLAPYTLDKEKSIVGGGFSFRTPEHIFVINGIANEDNTDTGVFAYVYKNQPGDETEIQHLADFPDENFVLSLKVNFARRATETLPHRMDFTLERTKDADAILSEPKDTYTGDALQYQPDTTSQTDKKIPGKARLMVTYNGDFDTKVLQDATSSNYGTSPLNDLGLSVVSNVVCGLETFLKDARKYQ